VKVLAPTVFAKTTHLIDSNAGETVSLWNSGTTYALGNTVRYGDRIYESLQGSNTNKNPATQLTWWLDIGPSNVMAMFDQQVSTASTRTSPLTVVLATGNCDALALIGLDGVASVEVTGRRGVGGTVVYTGSAVVSGAGITDWYEWFFEPEGDELSDVILTDIPPYTDLVLTVEIEGSGTVSCGVLVFGFLKDLGITEAGPKVGIIDYSRKDTDEFGVTTFVERAYSRRFSISAVVENSVLNGLLRTLAALRAKPSVWIGHDDAQFSRAMVAYGFYRDFTVDIAYPAHSLCSLEIEGLT